MGEVEAEAKVENKWRTHWKTIDKKKMGKGRRMYLRRTKKRQLINKKLRSTLFKVSANNKSAHNQLIDARLSCKGSPEAVAVATRSVPSALIKLQHFM